MEDRENLLVTYCDLRRIAPLRDLETLRNPGQAHPSTRESLRLDGLAERGEDGWQLTPAGQELLTRAEVILTGEWQPEPPLLNLPSGDFRFRRGAGILWGLSAAHLKALRALAACPGRAWRSLQSPFGARVLLELKEQGLATGEPRRGSAWHLTPKGLEMLKQAVDISSWHRIARKTRHKVDDYPYLIFCGGLDTMQKIAQRGVRALDPKTMRWKTVSKTARYKAVETERFVADDGVENILGNLMCNENLRQIAKERGLILP